MNVGCPGPIIKPRHGAIVSREIEVELEEEACVSVNGVERCGTFLEFADLPEGRNDVQASTGECLTTISVDVRSTKREYERPLLITAASEAIRTEEDARQSRGLPPLLGTQYNNSGVRPRV